MRTMLALAALAALASPARAGAISSAYTDLDWKKDCVTYAEAKDGEGDWADLACSGYRGYPVLIAYDDERESLFYGFPAADMTSVWESFTAFNASTGKVEWRIETDGDVAVPFAAIHRRSVSNADNPDKSTEVLLVSKVAQPEAREGCTVGVVLAPATRKPTTRRGGSPTRRHALSNAARTSASRSARCLLSAGWIIEAAPLSPLAGEIGPARLQAGIFPPPAKTICPDLPTS
jgi:hypothetical protein